MGAMHSQKTGPLHARSRAKPSGSQEGQLFDHLCRLLIVGDADTGKTCCVDSFAKVAFRTIYIPTMGVEFRMCDVCLDDSILKLEVFHAAGQERFWASIVTSYYSSAQGIVIVYDTTRMETFSSVQKWIQEARHYGRPDTPFVLLGNKCDLTAKKEVSYETAKGFADEHGVALFEVSAKDGTNIELAVITLVADIMAKHPAA